MASKGKQKQGARCCVCGVYYRQRMDATHCFFSFPRNTDLSDRWAEFVDDEKITNCDVGSRHKKFFICNGHFELEMFSHQLRGAGLIKNAIPTLRFDEPPSAKRSKVEMSTSEQLTAADSVSSLLEPSPTSSRAAKTTTSVAKRNMESSTLKQSAASSSAFSEFQAGSSTSSEDVPIPQPISDFPLFPVEARPTFLSVESTVETQENVEVSLKQHRYAQTGIQEQSISRRSCAVQTTSTLSQPTPRTAKLRRMIKPLKQRELRQQAATAEPSTSRGITTKELFTFIESKFPESTAKFMKSHYDVLQRKPKGTRYGKEEKQFALTVYFLGGSRTYKFLRKTFHLPSTSTLKRFTSPWHLPPGLHNFLFDLLTAKVKTLEETARDCIMCIDEMALKSHFYYLSSRDEIVGFENTGFSKTFKPATAAMVLMARGIHSEWKQPLAYFLVNGSCNVHDLHTIVKEAIDRVQKTGLNVHALISDQGSNFYSLSQRLGVTPDHPYFSLNDKNIFYMFDTPHLLKSVRNHFFENHLRTTFGITDKKYLGEFYEHMQKLTHKHAFRLTQAHIYPNNFQKMKVKYAAQVFSQSVVHFMNVYLSLTSEDFQISAEATPTVQFIDAMDQLFDLFNSTPKSQDVNKWALKPFAATVEQMNFLTEMENMFRNMGVLKKNDKKDITGSMRFIKGWLINIAALRGLWDALKDKNMPLFTGRLNQDCLGNFFGEMRQQRGNEKNPSPFKFMCNFKRLFRHHFMKSDHANCQEDFDQLLLDLAAREEGSALHYFEVAIQERTIFTPLTTETLEHDELKRYPAENALFHICGYLAQKCSNKHSCDTCKAHGTATQVFRTGTLFTYLKALAATEDRPFGKLMTPDFNFYEYIKCLDSLFVNKFPEFALLQHAGLLLKSHLDQVEFHPPCTNFPKEYLKTLFVRMRIFHLLRNVNKQLRAEKQRGQNRRNKMIILYHL